ncbi:interleukin 19 like [Scyliorhinus canicula]|uniref:interleukin 19 like n=1 Tax=Scyliorhinus canicula TaxID=7830 RepID=UPI0018F33A21|nr:interleukin 19 like [Scyliorhinus canicula]
MPPSSKRIYSGGLDTHEVVTRGQFTIQKVFGFPLTMQGLSYIFVAALASQLILAQGTRLHFGQCTFTANMDEIQQAFSDIRQAIQAEDTTDDVRLLPKSSLRRIQVLIAPINLPFEAQESCCFLRHMLRFYVETVFKHHTPSNSLIQRRTSRLANSFLSIKRDLRQCHSEMRCHCGEESRIQMQKMQNTFENLTLRAAAVKAIGEIDILIEWMEQSHQN